jgi:hypothetical protein
VKINNSLNPKNQLIMRKQIIFLLSVLFACGIQAQTLKIPTKIDAAKTQENLKTETNKATSQANIGSLIGQLTNNISDNALTDSFKKNKTGFISSLANVKDAAGASTALQTLQSGLLPTAMNAGWSKIKDKWLKDAKAANSLKSISGVVNTLESNIKGKNFKSGWAQVRSTWQAGLSALSK